MGRCGRMPFAANLENLLLRELELGGSDPQSQNQLFFCSHSPRRLDPLVTDSGDHCQHYRRNGCPSPGGPAESPAAIPSAFRAGRPPRRLGQQPVRESLWRRVPPQCLPQFVFHAFHDFKSPRVRAAFSRSMTRARWRWLRTVETGMFNTEAISAASRSSWKWRITTIRGFSGSEATSFRSFPASIGSPPSAGDRGSVTSSSRTSRASGRCERRRAWSMQR